MNNETLFGFGALFLLIIIFGFILISFVGDTPIPQKCHTITYGIQAVIGEKAIKELEFDCKLFKEIK